MSYLTQTPYKEITISGMSMEVPENDKINVNVNSSTYSTYIDKKYGFEVYVIDSAGLNSEHFDEATEFSAVKKLANTYATSVEEDDVNMNKSSYEVYSYNFKQGSKEILIYSGSPEYVAHAVKTLKMGSASVADITNVTNTSSTGNSSTSNMSLSTDVTNAPATTGPLKIQKLSISTAREIEALTYIKMYVGTQHAGKAVKVSSVFSNKKNTMCEEKVLSKKVDSQGYVNFASIVAFAKFPDHGIIKLYTADGTLSDTKEVTIVPRQGTQTF